MDKVKVARSFSRSAGSYDKVAWFQRRVGERLLSFLPRPGNLPPGVTLDLGCGTGYFVPALIRAFPGNVCIAIDIAMGMLRHCQKASTQQKNARQPAFCQSFMCADVEQLPLAANSVAVVWSNFTFQWCDDPEGLLAGLYRVTAPGGVIAFSTPGPRTLIELKQAWAQVDNFVHVNHFIDSDHWQRAIGNNNFTVKHFHSQTEVLRYDSIRQLLCELKQLGAHNINEGQRQGLTGRHRIEAFFRACEPLVRHGQYPATWEVFHWILKKA